MELIKQIKKAEGDSKGVIEQAKADSAQIISEAAAKRSQQLEQADQRRSEAIEKAIGQGKAQGTGEVTQLKEQAEQLLEKLCGNAARKSDAAVARIVEAIK